MDYTKEMLKAAAATAHKKRMKKLRAAFTEEEWEQFNENWALACLGLKKVGTRRSGSR